MNCVAIVPLIAIPFLSEPTPKFEFIAANNDVKLINKALKVLHAGRSVV
jgi:hypothetical protein